jgi:long-chain acyl-CoA synthetase
VHPSIFAQSTPDKPAVILAETGEQLSYAHLDAASNRAAQLFRSHGLAAGDVVAYMLENSLDFYALAWGAQRAGLYFVCMSTRLTQAEASYIISNSGAKLLVASASLASTASTLAPHIIRYAHDGEIAGWDCWEAAVADMADTPITDERAGTDMLYSSGTTGMPKGVRVDLPEDPSIAQMDPLTILASAYLGIGAQSIYLSPAPLYHAAPLRWSMRVHKLGGTVVLMRKFDPAGVLDAIARYKISCGQFVPTHFVRILKLPAEERAAYDVSSMTCAIHASAPCPAPVKQAMIDYWGPVLQEYYAGSEGNGMTLINSAQWQERFAVEGVASVGTSVHGVLHICDDAGNEVAARTEGTVYFESPTRFEYFEDAEKTAASYNQHGWSTLGDVGWVDDDKYLYLTDRKSFMIISGGVNIYPQEIENHLINHPKIADIAVFGGPHAEMGEEVIAVVQPVDMRDAGDDLRADITVFAREKLSGVKLPRRIDFMAELPRHDTGKLYKRLLKDSYWKANEDAQKDERA